MPASPDPAPSQSACGFSKKVANDVRRGAFRQASIVLLSTTARSSLLSQTTVAL